MSTTPVKSSLDSKNDTPIGVRLGDGTDDFVLIRRDLLAVSQDRGKTRDLPSVGVATPTENKSVPRALTGPGKPVLSSTGYKIKTASGSRSGPRGKLKPLKTVLVFRSDTAGSLSTPFAPVIAVEPALSGEWSDLIALYDECKVEEVKATWNFATTPGTFNGLKAVVAYAPTDTAALTSIVSGCEYSQHSLVSSSGGSIGEVAPICQTKTGMWNFVAQMPKGQPARSASTAATFIGEWSSCTDTADAYGYLKWYIEAADAGTLALDAIMYLTVHFRSRQ